MKSLIEIGIVALVVGGVSAGASFYWQQQLRKTASADARTSLSTEEKAADQKADTSESGASDSEACVEDSASPAEAPRPGESAELARFGPPVAVRPPFDPHGDEAGDLINRLRVRAASASRQEKRVGEREELMKLIFDDLRVEQSNSAKIRQRITEETNQSVRAADEARRQSESERLAIQNEQVETRRSADEQIRELRREKDEATQSAENALKSVREEQEEMKKQLDECKTKNGDKSGSPDESVNLKKMIGVVDSMPPEDTAKILQELVEKQKIEAVVAILNAMKPRQSAKVISAITEAEPILAADLVDRLKKLKSDGETSAAPAK